MMLHSASATIESPGNAGLEFLNKYLNSDVLNQEVARDPSFLIRPVDDEDFEQGRSDPAALQRFTQFLKTDPDMQRRIQRARDLMRGKRASI
jgi:hypothetical protein